MNNKEVSDQEMIELAIEAFDRLRRFDEYDIEKVLSAWEDYIFQSSITDGAANAAIDAIRFLYNLPNVADACTTKDMCHDAPWPKGFGHYSRTGHCGCTMGTRRICVKHCGGHRIPDNEEIYLKSEEDVRHDERKKYEEKLKCLQEKIDEWGPVVASVKHKPKDMDWYLEEDELEL